MGKWPLQHYTQLPGPTAGPRDPTRASIDGPNALQKHRRGQGCGEDLVVEGDPGDGGKALSHFLSLKLAGGCQAWLGGQDEPAEGVRAAQPPPTPDKRI